jgi:hypothetical protein
MMIGGFMIISHAISMTMSLAIFISLYRKNQVRGKWFLAVILPWGAVTLFRLFDYSIILGITTVIIYITLSGFTIYTIKSGVLNQEENV